MNLFYEDYPSFISVDNDVIPIRTDFRDYIKLMDILRSKEETELNKAEFICSFFLKTPSDMSVAIDRLLDFINMRELEPPSREEGGAEEEEGEEAIPEEPTKILYSFEYDYAYILSAFLQCYKINLREIDYMHWWEFRILFYGLPADTEIKQRIHYRGLDLSEIKDKEERKRIQRIQNKIRLPGEELSDYDIGNAFM